MTPQIKCLPECDERHADGCPVEKAEMEYWRAYFAVGTPAFYNFAPADYVRREDNFDHCIPVKPFTAVLRRKK